MMENGGGDENQGMRHVMRQYCTGGTSIEGQNGNSSSNSNKHSYFLRAKPPRSRAIDEEEEELFYKRPSSSSSSYHPAQSSEDEDLAADCLVMLSNKSDNQENRASSKNDHNNNTNNSSSSNISNNKEQNCKAKQQVVEKGMFQCKACKKVFNSHQALGGHRASHKKVKGCYAARLDGPTEEENPDDEPSRSEPLTPSESDGPRPGPGPATSNPRRTKMHECSVCRRVFSSGQALGGHKRCHWLTNSSDNAFIPHFHDFQYDHQSREICKKKPVFVRPPHHNLDLDHELDLNLNLPAPQIHENFDDGKTNKSRYDALRDLQQLAKQNHQQKSVEVEKNDEKAREKELRKLSDLRDMNMDGGWLQMGIPY
ncbi:hypothetical protein ABFX02_01G096300 [Erythranthe guttata]